MPKSRVTKRGKAKKNAERQVNIARRKRLNELQDMWDDLKVHEAAAREVNDLIKEAESDPEHPAGESDEGRGPDVDGGE